jgi:Arm DNA-binding domain
MQLTAKRVATLVKRPGRYHDGHGLILVVVNPTNASWQLRYQRNGRERWLGLGPLHTVTLKDARERHGCNCLTALIRSMLDGLSAPGQRRS